MAVYKTKDFARFARKAGVSDSAILGASNAIGEGRWDADLGSGVFKQRIARDGGGKSGGFRSIILFKAGKHSFVVHGFAKSDKANVTPKELKALKLLAATLLHLHPDGLRAAAEAGEIVKVESDDEERKNVR